MLRRQARLRREYLYRKAIEERNKVIQDKKTRLKQSLEENVPIHTDLRKDALALQKKLKWEDEGPARSIALGNETGGGGTTHEDDEYRWAGVENPKVLVTTSRDPSSRLKVFAKELRLVIPNTQRMNRGNHDIGELVSACRANDVTDLLIVHEHRGVPDGLVVCHLPYGPTAYFNLSGVIMRHDIPEVGTLSEQYPHLIFHNLSTKLGRRVTSILKYLFPVPKDDSRRVITFANHDDVVCFRHHMFRKLQASDHLEVTGVSRSGRVRKKSSKLTDFESPDEIDPRYRRRVEREPPPVANKSRIQPTQQSIPVTVSSADNTPVHGHQRGRIAREPSPINASQSEDEDEDDEEEEEEEGEEEVSFVVKQESESSMESDSEAGMFPHEGATAEDFSSDSSGGSFEEEGEMEEEGIEEEEEEEEEDNAAAEDMGSNQHLRNKESDPAVSQATSLYMLEKSSKKKLIVRDGKIVGRMKAQRKDKGKTRFTAYMLWAKEVRQEILRVNPDMDFATISKRLGELWATVPNNEKYNWKRRAKRLAVKGNRMGVIDTARWKSPPARNKFLNKAGSRPVDRSSSRWQNSSQAQRMAQTASQQVMSAPGTTPESPGAGGGSLTGVTDPAVGTGLYKVVGTQPVDVAAHLGLLGESLTIIGERLTEHEGQIAVSGSLSVLLDSLLCAIGPLLCLTQQIPEAAHACPQHVLSKILDNIAYVMPGL